MISLNGGKNQFTIKPTYFSSSWNTQLKIRGNLKKKNVEQKFPKSGIPKKCEKS